MFGLFVRISLIVFLFAVPGWGATYTVCSSGCDETAIQDVFDNNDLASGDVVNCDGTFYEQVTWGTNDGGSAGDPVILQAATGSSCTLSAAYVASSWTEDSGEYYIELESTSHFGRLVKENGAVIPEGTAGSLNAGEWATDGVPNPHRLYYLPTSGSPGDQTVEYVTNDSDNGTALTIDGVDYVTVRNMTVEMGGGASSPGHRLVYVNDASNVTISDAVLRHAYLALIEVDGNSDDFILEDSDLYGCNDALQIIGDADDSIIRRNEVYEIGWWSWNVTMSAVDREALTVGSLTSTISGTQFLDNHIYNICLTNAHQRNCSGIYSYRSDSVVMARNRIHDTTKIGIYHTGGNTAAGLAAEIYNNVIYDIGGSTDNTQGPYRAGIFIRNANGSGLIGSKVYNNTIYNIDGTGAENNADMGTLVIKKDFDAQGNATLDVKNNILVGTSTAPALHLVDDAATFNLQLTIDNDLYDLASGTVLVRVSEDFDGTPSETDYTEAQFSNYQSDFSAFGESSSINSDPLFSNATNYDFRVPFNSPVVDAGTSLSIHVDGWTDFNGNQFGCGNAFDIGAIEYCWDSEWPPLSIALDNDNKLMAWYTGAFPTYPFVSSAGNHFVSSAGNFFVSQ